MDRVTQQLNKSKNTVVKKKIWILVTILWYKCFQLLSKCFHQQSTVARNNHFISYLILQIRLLSPPEKLLPTPFNSQPPYITALWDNCLPSLPLTALLLCKLKIFYGCSPPVPVTLLWQIYISVPSTETIPYLILNSLEETLECHPMGLPNTSSFKRNVRLSNKGFLPYQPLRHCLE